MADPSPSVLEKKTTSHRVEVVDEDGARDALRSGLKVIVTLAGNTKMKIGRGSPCWRPSRHGERWQGLALMSELPRDVHL